MTLILAALVVVNCIVLAAGFYTLVHLALGNRKTSESERFYAAWQEHLHGGFEATQPAANALASKYGLSSAPPLAEDEKA